MSLDIDLMLVKSVSVHSQNITHNLGAMADEAGLYDVLWRGPENGIKFAGQLIDPLRKGIEMMRSDPARFKKFNPENGWGSYGRFLPWLEQLLTACEENPEATVDVSV